MDAGSSSKPTDLLSSIHSLSNAGSYPTSAMPELHPFAESHGDNVAVLPQLRNIYAVISSINLSLSAHTSINITDPKLVSLMRQKATITQELNTAETSLKSRLKALRERAGIEYGEDIPPKSNLVDWFLARLEEWGKAAEMQVFSDPEPGKVAVAMAGMILVLDIEFQINNSDEDVEIALKSLKSSHASAVDAPATSTSTLSASDASLDTFLTAVINEYLEELQRKESKRDPILIAKLGRALKEYLKYIMKLDHLAQREIDGGPKCFTEVDDLSSVAQQAVPKEARTVAQSLELPKAPFDILLLRGHALPAPYLNTPSLSFLVYLSPRSYLSLLRSVSQPDSESKSDTDIPITVLRSYFSKSPPLNGSVLVTLSLGRSSQPGHFAQPYNRPTFPLIPSVEPLDDNDFQTIDHILPFNNGPDAWILDFGDEGIVMSQTRMWEIYVFQGLVPNDSLPMMSFGYSGSWVDLLVQGPTGLPCETYEAIYSSPTNAHPPLQLRLTAPAEPGFILRKIRVQSLREIWAIFEIVKEQAWYNNLLNSCKWVPVTGLDDNFGPKVLKEKPDVKALLSGSVTPKKIPVNVTIESPLFDTPTPLHRLHPIVKMQFPGKGLSSRLNNIFLALDTASNYGIQVVVNGIRSTNPWEEAARRGGGLGLPGRFWMASKENDENSDMDLS
ncbi:hypothetical protein M422DRAFT_28049 [Sphaerobolus stellatus SS14]|nr:hypothetical protein M422DRAFT_28049 [Sphaerobolus stellatus SS14]